MLAALLDRDEVRRQTADRRAGEVAAAVANASPALDRKRYPRGVTWLHFFPEWKEPAPAQTEEQMFDAMMLWTKARERRGAKSA